MVETVIKRDGSKEPFVPEKIIISTVKTGVELDKSRKIARKVLKKFRDQKEVKSTEIRGEVIKHLNKEKGVIDKTEPIDAIEEVKNAEKRLKKDSSWGTEEVLLLSFDSTKKFNEFSKKINYRDNVELKDIEEFGDEIIVEVIVIPPNRTIH